MQTRGQRRARIQGLTTAQAPTNTSQTPSGLCHSSKTLTKQEHGLTRASVPSPPAHESAGPTPAALKTQKNEESRHKRRHQKQPTHVPQPVNYTVQQYLVGVQAFQAARTAAAGIAPREERLSHPQPISLGEQHFLACEETLPCYQTRRAQGDAASLEGQGDFPEGYGESHDEQSSTCDEY